MRSEVTGHGGPTGTVGLFDDVLARGPVRSLVADAAWLSALLEVEAALARASARAGVIPAEAGSVVSEVCSTVRLEVPDLAAAAAGSGNPVVPLVERLRSAMPAGFGEYVHKGATSQDIHDSATMLVAHRTLTALKDDVAGAADAAADLARAYRDAPAVGRTLLQQALPITLGLKAAGWMVGLDAAWARLHALRLPVQFGGAAGTWAGLDGRGATVVRELATELGLAEPTLPWHTVRTPIADLAGALGTTAGAAGKVARDITLLAQDEVAEVREGKPGGSSAMAHKRNPVAAICALAGAAQAPGLVSTLLAAMVQEHERAAGAWHAEWRPLRELLVSTGSAVSWLRECLTQLVVDPSAAQRNLDRFLAASGVPADVGEAPALVDRALAARESRRQGS